MKETGRGGHGEGVDVARTRFDDGAGELPAELARVYRSHHGFVWRILGRLGVPRALLEDATQDVFVVVHRRWDDLRPDVSIRSWLFGIARRVASSVRRGELRTRRRLQAVPPPPAAASPEEAARRAEAAALVDVFLESLDPDKRLTFVLAEIEGLTAPEIAEAMEVKLNTVYSRLHAARRRFARFLRQRGVGS